MSERPVNIDREILGQMIETRALKACQDYDVLVHKPRYEEMTKKQDSMEATLKVLVSFADRIKGGWAIVAFLMTAVIVLAEHYWK